MEGTQKGRSHTTAPRVQERSLTLSPLFPTAGGAADLRGGHQRGRRCHAARGGDLGDLRVRERLLSPRGLGPVRVGRGAVLHSPLASEAQAVTDTWKVATQISRARRQQEDGLAEAGRGPAQEEGWTAGIGVADSSAPQQPRRTSLITRLHWGILPSKLAGHPLPPSRKYPSCPQPIPLLRW